MLILLRNSAYHHLQVNTAQSESRNRLTMLNEKYVTYDIKDGHVASTQVRNASHDNHVRLKTFGHPGCASGDDRGHLHHDLVEHFLSGSPFGT